jgi:hypothetical protein
MCSAFAPIFNLVGWGRLRYCQYPENIESNGKMNYELEMIWKDRVEAWRR